MKNDRVLLNFTELMMQLCSSGISIRNSCRILWEQNNSSTDISSLAKEVACGLEQGRKFSMILRNNSFLEIPPWYCGIVEVAEECGCLTEALQFLLSLLKDKNENLRKMWGSLLYPLFLMTATFGFSLILKMFVLPDVLTESSSTGVFKLAFQTLSFAFFVLAGLVVLEKQFFRVPGIVIFLKTLSFTFEKGVPPVRALDCCLLVVSGDKKMEQLVLGIRKHLIWGNSVKDAFEVEFKDRDLSGSWCYLKEKLSVSLVTGDKKCFAQAASQLLEREKIKQNRFISCVQPGVIFVTSFYILLIVREVIMPVLIFEGGVF